MLESNSFPCSDRNYNRRFFTKQIIEANFSKLILVTIVTFIKYYYYFLSKKNKILTQLKHLQKLSKVVNNI